MKPLQDMNSWQAGRSWLPRRDLCARILASRAAVVVLEAPGGMGKTALLHALSHDLDGLSVATGPRPAAPEMGDILLWDVPRQGGVLPESEARIILARRPDTPVTGLARLRLYGHVETFDSADLAFSADELVAAGIAAELAHGQIDATGGWPALSALTKDAGSENLERFFIEEIATGLSLAALVAIDTALAGRVVDPSLAVDLPPLPTDPGFRTALAAAIRAEIARRATRPGEAALLARNFLDAGQVTEAITLLQQAGDMTAAIAMLDREGGPYFIQRHGPRAFDRVLAGFNGAGHDDDPVVHAARVMQAVKSGELPLALRLLGDRYGPGIHQPEVVLSPDSPFPAAMRILRLVIFIYEDIRLDETLLENAARIPETLSIDRHLLRGSYHNAILEFRVRTRRQALARDAAVSAMKHYRRARAPILEFYVSLHLAFIEVISGGLVAARRAVSEAAAALARVSFDSPGDHRILALVRAVIDFEAGRPEPLARFLDGDFEDFAQGELWPSLTEIALHYGSALIAGRDGVNAARGFLDRLRLHHARAPQLHVLITIREVTILQDAGRWQEAAELLHGLADRDPRLNMPGDSLANAEDREVIAFALARLRQVAFDSATPAGPARALNALARNPRLTHHQRVTIAVLLAWLQRRDRDASGARRSLRALFEAAARDGTLAGLAAEAPFLGELLANRRIRDYLDSSAACRTVLRRLRDTGPSRHEAAARAGLTRREARILDALCEGASNKLIAKTLGLSESTVKFHLANLYRKLGVATRREAVVQADGDNS